MKKVLLLALTVAFAMVANAQSLSFKFQDVVYSNGDTVRFVTTDAEMPAMYATIHNNTERPVHAQGSLEVISSNMTVASICAGECLEGSVSPIFTVAPNSDFDGVFVCDFFPNSETDGFFSFKLYNTQATDDTLSLTFHVHVQGVGINNVETNSINAYPNPAASMINVDYELAEGTQNAQIVIVNLMGQVVKSVALHQMQGTASINVEDLPAGVYTYGIKGQSNMKKVVVR